MRLRLKPMALAALGCLLTLSAAFSSQLATRQSACDSGPWARPIRPVGGMGGYPFCETRWRDGLIMKGMEVWADNGRVRGIEFTYSDGSISTLYGERGGEKRGRIDWNAAEGDAINSITLYGDGRGRRVGRIIVRTQSGKELDVGKNTSGQDAFAMTVGSGVLVGAFGHSGADIDNLGFLFLASKIQKVDISDLVLDSEIDIEKDNQVGISVVTLDEVQYYNNHATDDVTNFEFSNSHTRTNSYTYSQATTDMWGLSVSVTLAIKPFGIGGEVESGFQWEHTKTSTTQTTKSMEVTLQYKVSADVKSGETILCKSQSAQGEVYGGYTSKVTLTFEDGTQWSYSERGTVAAMSYSEAFAECKRIDRPDTTGSVSVLFAVPVKDGGDLNTFARVALTHPDIPIA
ncbi:hypothetical protein AJ80_00610 [Polytolypa hystricis UAMH7299]|uniref:Jacalin-type lectin domain-containing protein n=1 Tax=Polytolypa hystricis (strain UAMH7299) TaxID=1447883 RepID=A0A2B7Z443_POLH7|nr:hypothetical protein AJ80_00610 [Polytolypa hystricis UAMH7299]